MRFYRSNRGGSELHSLGPYIYTIPYTPYICYTPYFTPAIVHYHVTTLVGRRYSIKDTF